MKQAKLAFALIMISALNPSCTKDVNNHPESSTRGGNHRAHTVNPYGYIGQAHNEMLDGIAHLPSFPNTTLEEEYSVGKVVGSRFFPDVAPPGLEHVRKQMSKPKTLSLVSVSDRFVAKGVMTAKQRDNITIINSTIRFSDDADALNRKMRAFEQSLLNRNDMTDDEKAPLFGLSAVIKNSSRYWENVEGQLNNPWNGLDEPGGLPKWLADAIGYVDGFFECSGTLEEHHICGKIVSGLWSQAAAKGKL